MQNKTMVRTDELNLLIVGIRRAMDLYSGKLEIDLSDGKLNMHCIESGEVCEVRLSDNVNIKGD